MYVSESDLCGFYQRERDHVSRLRVSRDTLTQLGSIVRSTSGISKHRPWWEISCLSVVNDLPLVNVFVAKIINQLDGDGNLPLGLALAEKQTAIANVLCEHKADVNAKDQAGWSLLQRAIQRGDAYSAEFLISHNADVFCVTPGSLDTCLHLVCAHGESVLSCDEPGEPFYRDTSPKSEVSLDITNKMADIAKILLERGLDPSKKNAGGFTPLHVAIMTKNMKVFNILLNEESIDVNAKTAEGFPPLWYALYQTNQFDSESFAKKLLVKGAKADIVCSENRETLLQLIIRENFEDAALFLLEYIPSDVVNVNHMNTYGETAMHLAIIYGHTRLVSRLLKSGANVNIETVSLNGKDFRKFERYSGYKHTCLHYAIIHHQIKGLEVLINHHLESQPTDNSLDCNLRDSNGNTPLSLSILLDLKEAIPLLLKGGADINAKNTEGLTVLHQAIRNGYTETAIFLLNNGADINILTKDGTCPLQLCIEHHLPQVVESLCRRGVDMSVPNQQGHCPLWAALASGQEDIAHILVRNGVDTDAWGEGPDGCYQTLLHKAIDESNQSIARFLIQSGCDLNTPRRPSPEGRGGDESHDGYTPLHLCCQWGLVDVVQALVEHDTEINKTDSEGKSPLHLAIENQHKDIISLLLCHPRLDLTVRDKSGLTPFAAALTYRNNKAAQAILDKLPSAAEQFNNKGQNFLHVALQNNQVENVLFLLSIKVDVNSRVKDSTQTPPLHLAAAGGNEVLVRSLILSGAKVNEVDAYKQTALHVAASKGHVVVVSALLQNDAQPEMCDTDGNNPLHIACKQGHLAVARVLLTESNLEADMINLKGHNPLHVLAIYGKENAASICSLFIETDFPLDKQDFDGNTALLLAYMKGNGNLCRCLVKAGACLGCMNRDGVTLFNYQVATKQLLTSLLDSLEREPPWATGDICLECVAIVVVYCVTNAQDKGYQ
ncbi:hypothetical protein RUM43_010196 [Polyplax serrata]|uniref:Uncharacterized protein n=1 Tax=Polyplax serrata TaxID=468196 RepID=A0AAN8S4Q8_POLSC